MSNNGLAVKLTYGASNRVLLYKDNRGLGYD